MVPSGQHIEAHVKQIVGELRRNAEAAGGVFSVRNRQVNVFGRNNIFQVAGDDGPPGRRKDVADKQDVGQGRECYFFLKERTAPPHQPPSFDPELKGGTLRAPSGFSMAAGHRERARHRSLLTGALSRRIP